MSALLEVFSLAPPALLVQHLELGQGSNEQGGSREQLSMSA